jgi:prepilin-type N-terminal cleavage/methylation domain-containing protein
MQSNRQEGFTIIELMIALVISAVVTAAVYGIFITQQKTYAIQSGVTDMQQNARAALMLMVRDLRMAGVDIGSSFSVQDYAGTAMTASTTVIQGAGDDPDEITVVYATEPDTPAFVSTVSSNVVTLTNASGFSAGDFVAFETVSNVYSITGVTSNDLTLTPGTELPGHLDVVGDAIGQTGARAYLVKAITYRLVDDGTCTNGPCLLQRRDSTDPTANNEIAVFIADLQITQNYTGDSRLVQVILTAEYEDYEGTQRQRQYDAVVQLRN